MKRLTITSLIKPLTIIVSFLVVSCRGISENDLLRFPVKETGDKIQPIAVFPESVFSETLNLIGFKVLDDKLIACADYTTDHCLDVIDLSSGEYLQGLCRKGRGPGEFLDISPLFSIEDQSVIVYDPGTGRLSMVSVRGDNQGSVLHQIQIESSQNGMASLIMSLYKVKEDAVLAYNSIQGSSELVAIDNPYYALYDWNNGRERYEFNLFDASPLARSSEWVSTTAFDLRDCINREKTTVCFAMGTMPVFGYLDIPSGKVKGFRLKGEPPFSMTENRQFFTGICAQGHFIYALYLGNANSELAADRSKTKLYKLDWEGHILNKYEMDGIYLGCCATPDKLYLSKAEDGMNWGLYQLNIKML